MGERVAPDVQKHDQVAAEPARGFGDRGAERGRRYLGVDEHRALSAHARDVRLGEQEAAWAAGVRTGERDLLVERLDSADLGEPPWAWVGIDRPSLPRQSADDCRGADHECGLGDRERTDNIASTADAQAEDPLCAGQGRKQRTQRAPLSREPATRRLAASARRRLRGTARRS